MKDSAISYDIVNQQQQPPVSSWQQHRQQQHQHQQTHTTSVYSNHTAQQQDSQRNPIGTHHHQQQQNQQQHAAQLGQYQHQQLQSSAHHNTAAAAAAAANYYQAHMYPTYQAHAHPQDQQQQHTGTEHQQQQQQQHHHGSSINASGSASSVVGAAVVAGAQQPLQQHAAVHHSQAASAQTPTLNHTGWSQGVGGLASQAGHHTVVTDHSTLAYMTHAYQSHNNSVNDHHHRNSSASIANQPIGTGPQGSSYAIDALYNTPAAAAAAVAAAYGYNNYNAAFFQTSNNGPHTQTGHPSPAGLSGFWGGHDQSQQHSRTAHSQAVPNQASLQQRQQQLAPDQANSYMHDPRLYYGRPYGQGMQNFGQQHSQTQPQADVVHQRLAALSQSSLIQQHDQQIHQLTQQQNQQIHHQAPAIANQSSPTGQGTQNSTTHHHLNQSQAVESHMLASNQLQADSLSQHDQHNRKLQTIGGAAAASNLIQKQPLAETETQKSGSTHNDNDQFTSKKQSIQPSPLTQKKQPITSSKPDPVQATKLGISEGETNDPKSQTTVNSLKSDNKPQSVIKSDLTGQYQSRKQSNTVLPRASGRNIYHTSQDDRLKPQSVDPPKKIVGDRDQRQTALAASMDLAAKNQSSTATASTLHQNTDSNISALEDTMSAWSIGARKTTWASIASQPAKVSQPKSLKSKIAGSSSVLSSAKHLNAVSIDSSSLESKNGINPAIKSSVSAAATSIQRSSIPPPISKTSPTTAVNLKLDILGENSESSKISWPAVNASANLTLNDPPLQKEVPTNNQSKQTFDLGERHNREDKLPGEFKDHNHNHNQSPKTFGSYQPHNNRRDDRRGDDHWQRRDFHHGRNFRDSERKDQDFDNRPTEHQMDHHRDQMMNSRRDVGVKPGGNRPGNQFRGTDEAQQSSHRDRDRDYSGGKRGGPGPGAGLILERNNDRSNDIYHNPRFPKNRFEHPRDHHENRHHNNNNTHNSSENAPHHHYNNVRDGNSSRQPQSKPDLSVHPHLNPANFNPKTFNCEPENARYFIIKSYSEDDIHRSIKYSIWCSTNHGNKRLDEAYRQQQAKNGQLFLFFSVNGSGHFCGMAQMTSAVDFDSSSGVWAQSKWQGEFSVKWIYVKDVPNSALRHITLENNEDKPVTNSRDTQEVPSEKGKAVLKILHQYDNMTSIFDDFLHYERRQEEEKLKKSTHLDQPLAGRGGDERGGARFNNRPYMNARPHNDFQGGGGGGPGGWGNRDRMPRYPS